MAALLHTHTHTHTPAYRHTHTKQKNFTQRRKRTQAHDDSGVAFGANLIQFENGHTASSQHSPLNTLRAARHTKAWCNCGVAGEGGGISTTS